MTASPRIIAVKIIYSVVKEGKSLSALLQNSSSHQDIPKAFQVATRRMRSRVAECTNKYMSGETSMQQSRALKGEGYSYIQALCYGVLRHYWELENIVYQLVKKPPKEKILPIVLVAGIYELLYMDTAEYAAVSEWVTTIAALKKPALKGFVNAVLRNFLRNKENFIKAAQQEKIARVNHPGWIIELIESHWPSQAESIFMANNQQAAMTLRVNQQHYTRDEYLKKLATVGLEAMVVTETQQGISLKKPCSVKDIPGFSEGDCSVQDTAAQLAGELLPLHSGAKVLDACAAPGGKATHLLEREPTIKLTTIDLSPERIIKIEENLKRLNQQAKVLCADALDLTAWWDGQCFDAILLDAPCSATGVIRRHPDIKHLRRSSDIIELSLTQLMMLKALWKVLKPEGYLLYTTCSILPEENADVIQAFLEEVPGAIKQPLSIQLGVQCKYGHQIFPGEKNADGFYYCLLQKMSL